jgi:hypothetical protein
MLIVNTKKKLITLQENIRKLYINVRLKRRITSFFRTNVLPSLKKWSSKLCDQPVTFIRLYYNPYFRFH